MTPTTIATVTPATATPALAVSAVAQTVTAAASGVTAVTFDAYLTSPETSDTVVDYTVVAAGAGYFGAGSFGGTLPSAQVTIAAGQTLVPFTIDLPQGALGNAPSDNLQVQVSDTAAVPVFAPLAQSEVVNNAPEAGTPPIAQFSELTGGGTLSFDAGTNTYALALGDIDEGTSPATVDMAVLNAATAPADSLSGAFTAPLGTGFGVTGNFLTSPIAAGAMYQGLDFTVKTNALGANSLTLSFDGEDVNDSGFSAAVTPITLTITDTVVAPGEGQLNTPQTIVFPNVHVGTPESQDLSVSNTGSAPIGVSVTGSGSITAQGSIAALAAGATNTTGLTVGVNTSAAGALSGAVQVDFGSSDPPVDVFGDVYNLATAAVAPLSTVVDVGAPGTIAVAITNTATANTFSENLLGTLAAVSGALSIAAAGPTGEIAAGGSNTSSLLLGFSTALAGTPSPARPRWTWHRMEAPGQAASTDLEPPR